MAEDSEYFVKRIKGALETVLPVMRTLYEGKLLKEKENELFSKIMEKFLPNQTHYTENDIKKAFSAIGHTSPVYVGDALKIMTEAVAYDGIMKPVIQKTRKIEEMIVPTAYRAEAGIAA